MDKTLRSILWVLVALVVLSSFSTGWFFVAKERLYNEYLNLETLFKTSMERLNRELASSNKKVTELESKLEVVEKELGALESKNRLLESQYEAALREKEDLDREVTRVKKTRLYLEKRLKDMESETFLAGLLTEKASLEVELKRLKDSWAPKDSEVERLKKETADLDAALSQVKEEKAFLERRLQDSTDVAEILSKDLLKERDKNQELRVEFEKRRTENQILKTKMSDLEAAADRYKTVLAEKAELQVKLSSLERDLDYKSQELEGLKVALATQSRQDVELRAETYHSPDKVDLPPIILEREDRGAMRGVASPLERITRSSTLTGRIITVNREHNFVVIDLGRQHGIDIGTGFDIYRGEIPIGSIEVIQTRERIAACDVEYIEEGFRIEIDDIVSKR